MFEAWVSWTHDNLPRAVLPGEVLLNIKDDPSILRFSEDVSDVLLEGSLIRVHFPSQPLLEKSTPPPPSPYLGGQLAVVGQVVRSSNLGCEVMLTAPLVEPCTSRDSTTRRTSDDDHGSMQEECVVFLSHPALGMAELDRPEEQCLRQECQRLWKAFYPPIGVYRKVSGDWLPGFSSMNETAALERLDVLLRMFNSESRALKLTGSSQGSSLLCHLGAAPSVKYCVHAASPHISIPLHPILPQPTPLHRPGKPVHGRRHHNIFRPRALLS